MSNSKTETLELGIYEHYKGARYRVIGVGKHTETEEQVVIYEPLYESDVAYWIRPYDMFNETVKKDGKVIQRFRKIQ